MNLLNDGGSVSGLGAAGSGIGGALLS